MGIGNSLRYKVSSKSQILSSEISVTPLLFVTDLDNTLVGDSAALEELNRHLGLQRQERGTKIVYATGRSLALYQELATEQNLLAPDALIVAVGTEIYYHGSHTPDPSWTEKLSHRWNREQVAAIAAHFADLIPQSDTEQRPFKASYYLAEDAAIAVLPRLELEMKERGLDVQLIYSRAKDLDILPKYGDKGQAMLFLRQHWGIDATRTVVCGDSGNDISLFSLGDERAIIVGNAQPELLLWYSINSTPHHYQAKASYAAGILEGLSYFGFLP